MNTILCVRIGDSGPFQQFDNPDDAIDYLNKQKVGQVEEWTHEAHGPGDTQPRGFTTHNHTGPWYVRIFWGGPANNFRAPLDVNDKMYIEHGLEEHVIVPVLQPGYAYLWVRVGDAGEYEKMDDLDAAIEYLNELCVGKITGWVKSGFVTKNYHGQDYISIYYGDHEENHLADIGENEDEPQEDHRQYVECNLGNNEL